MRTFERFSSAARQRGVVTRALAARALVVIAAMCAASACDSGEDGDESGSDPGGSAGNAGNAGASESGGAAGSGGDTSGQGGSSGGSKGGSGGDGGTMAGRGGALGGGAGTGEGGDGATEARSVSVTPASARVGFGERVQFSALVTGLADRAVTWTLEEGAVAGTISDAGLYAAPEASGTFHVVATAVADDTLRGSATVTVSAEAGTPPTLEPEIWTNLTPAELELGECCERSYGANAVELDPSSPRTLYLAMDQLGLWKTTDGGSSWRRLGDPEVRGPEATSYLDSPIRIEVDPNDPNHVYATQGVRGETLGFWVSRDAGETWTMPQGFVEIAATTTRDVTMMVVDPTDFDHVLLASHSPWPNLPNAGILESVDGGESWTAHPPPESWNAGTTGIAFLYEPALGLGDAQTWLVGTDGDGHWRTTNGGDSWERVSEYGIPHGGSDIYYSPTGLLYTGSTPYPLRSHDNGATWEQLTALQFAYYYTVYGDGNLLYTQVAYTGTNGGSPAPYYTSPESDGLTWTVYRGGEQTFIDGPYMMRFDAANGVMYAAQWGAGLWALKVPVP